MNPKVLLVVTQSETGGAQRYVHDLALGLSDRDYPVTVACGPSGPMIEKLRRQRIDVRVIPHLTRSVRPWRDGKAFWQIYQLLREEPFDIIHSNSSKAGFLVRMASRAAARRRNVFTAHGFVFQEERSFLTRRAFLVLEKLAGRLTERLITVCDADRRVALDHGIIGQDRVTTVHNGIAPSVPLTRARSRNALGLPLRGRVVGTVANFYANKGLLDFVQMAGDVSRRNPKAVFAMIGHGPQFKHVVKAIRTAGLKDKIHLYGNLNEAWKIMTAFDVFVLTSRKEGLPYSLLEAMNARVPVVATRVGGVQEAVDDTREGYLVPAGETREMADRVDLLLNDRSMGHRLGERGHNRILRQFNFNRMIGGTREVYDAILRS